MTEGDRDLLASIKWHVWVVAAWLGLVLAVLTAVFVLAIRHWDLADIKRWIDDSKCSCHQAASQVHQQHVNVSPTWSREDTIREELRRKWEKQNDVRGVGIVEGTERSGPSQSAN